MPKEGWVAPAPRETVSRNPLAFLDTAKPLPDHIAMNVNPGLWARALLMNDRYHEPRPGVMATAALADAMNDEDLFAQPKDSEIVKIGDYLPNSPMVSTGTLEASDLYVYASNGDDGAPTYIDVLIHDVDAQKDVTLRIGSRRVQMFYLKALALGTWPVRHRLARTDVRVKDTYTYTVLPPR